MMRRTSAREWCGAGLALLRAEGPGAVTLERLCQALDRTKGSFYHHFRDMDSYMAALLVRWEEDLTERLIQETAQPLDPRLRGERLEHLARTLDHALDRAVRAWALWDERARAAMERVDRRRMGYLAGLFEARGCRGARLLAEIKYLAFLGAQQAGVFQSPDHAATLTETLGKALEWLGRQEGDPEAPGAREGR